MTKHAIWIPAYIGLGSNLDDPPAQLRRAFVELGGLPATKLVAASALYRNPPMGAQDQPFFVNAVAGLLTQLPAVELLTQLKAIERAHGRRREAEQHWGPRMLDLDLLVYVGTQVNESGLKLPHPGISERNFVLFPLLEIAPGLVIPGLGKVSDLAVRLDSASLARLD